MGKILKIIQFELVTLLSRRSYRRIVLFVPIIGFLIYSGALLINKGIAPEGVTDLFSQNQTVAQQAIVDHSGLIISIPDDLMNEIYLVNDENSARQLIQDQVISSYFIIDKDYLENGRVDFIQRNYNFLATQAETNNLDAVIAFNLFKNHSASNRYLNPMDLKTITLGESAEKNFGGPNQFWLPYTIMMVFYILIIGASSLMLNSITNEKKNRVIEILLTSISPTEMLIGKTIALGIAGLLQTLVWFSSGFILLNLAGRSFSLSEAYALPPSLFAWGLVFFILGYALYSSLMAGLGALVPNPKEGSQATIVVIFPLIIPLFFSNLVATAPNALIFVILSIFPLTAPVSMISRMSATLIPPWQILLSIGLLIITTYFVVKSVARIFRAQSLLSGKPFNVKDYFRAFIKS
jgi:ABC-2 type transport system permease protein